MEIAPPLAASACLEIEFEIAEEWSAWAFDRGATQIRVKEDAGRVHDSAEAG